MCKKPEFDQEIIKKFSEVVLSRSPIGRFGEPYEIARSVVHLCEDSSAYITGAEIIIDGGMSINR